MGVLGFTPGSIDKSKSSPARRPCSLIGFLAVTVPFTDHTPVSIFFIAAFTSGSEFSWADPADFVSGLPKPEGAFAKTRNAVRTKIVLEVMVFFTRWLFRLDRGQISGRSDSLRSTWLGFLVRRCKKHAPRLTTCETSTFCNAADS